MTTAHEAARTLLKSPPELWAECSDPASLTRHLGGLAGEIRITRLEPESAVAWEGERASGTVRLEPSGWGTRVTLTALSEGAEPAPEAPEKTPEPPEATVAEMRSEPKPPEPKPRAASTPPPFVATPPPSEAPAPVPLDRPPAGRLLSRLRGLLGPRFEAEAGVPRAPEPASAAPALDPESEPEPASTAPALDPEPETTSPQHPMPPSGVSVASSSAADAPTGEPEKPAADAPTGESQMPAGTTPEPEVVLNEALDRLGQAHHRPFSRA